MLSAVDDEEAWLEALEKGELDDNGEIPKAKDLSLLTARQKALLDRNYSSNLVEEITTLREEVTEEEKQKRIEKNKRRKLQAAKKAKETQKQTIKKLVEIPSKFVKEKTKPCTATNRNNLFEMIKYINRRDMVVMSYPHGFEYPLKPQTSHPTPNPRMCSVCGLQRRKYECAKTRQSLCSLHCYKQNLKNTEAT
ncbi:unnamed protein product [Clavelina lepadiformis]|uniref:INO80 complex subunit B-like conserved region domain-containing protein n=1 Tax=Clavelina lepadiformis TaxID=159417 RepID=A0ABP0FBZ9_CLALP